MAASNANEWREARRQILLSLDVASEYEAFGLRLCSNRKPNAKGWISAHAWGADDKNPSAGVCVNDCVTLGYYRDFRSPERSCNFFDFACMAKGGTYADCLRHYAAKTGVKLPSGDEERAVDKLEFRTGHYAGAYLGFGEKQQYAAGKAGVTVKAIDDLGCRAAAWPKGLTPERQNQLLVVPMYGSSNLLEHEPTGWHCAAVHPARKIRKYQGKGHEEQLLKTMTLGEYGLMNVDGLARLADAKVVNIVEGLTDLLAVQAAIAAARETEPEYENHVVLSTGGASCGPKQEWLQHFAGKEIRVWGDVGDKDNAGQVGAMRWCSALHPVARVVRNVVLPLGKDGGKNDTRAWLTEEGAGRGYASMDQFAQTFEPLEAGDEAVEMSPHQALLKNLGLQVLGEHEQSQKIEVYCEETRKTATISDLDRLTVPKLIQLVGSERVEAHIHEGREPQPGKFQIKDVRNAIASGAAGNTFKAVDRIGGGVWDLGGELVLVRTQEAGVIRHGKIERLTSPFFKGKYLDLSPASEEWCDFGTLQRYLNEATRDEWCKQVFREATSVFAKWFWKQDSAPQMVTSLVIASWLQTTWDWRPEIYVTGDSDTGKSVFVEATLPCFFGALAWHDTKVTEASIRQHLRHHAKIPILDEFEHGPHRQAVLELWRVSGRGGKVSRGTADQKGVQFYIKHLPWFASVETGLKKQPDKNRFIIFEMQEIPEDRRGRVDFPSRAALMDLGQKLLAVGIRHHQRIKDLDGHLKRASYKGVPGRVLECFSLPAAIAASVDGMTLAESQMLLSIWLSQWDFDAQAIKDKLEVLESIMSSLVKLDRGVQRPVSQLLHELGPNGDPDITSALASVGLRLVQHEEGPQSLFLHPKTVQRHLMRDSDYSGHALSDYLIRIPGAKRETQRLAGRHVKGISIPREAIKGDDSRDRQPELTF